MKTIALRKRLFSFALAVIVVGSGFTVFCMSSKTAYGASGLPKIEKTDYEGKGRVDVEFYGKVRYHNAKVTVKNLSTGKSYTADIINKDNDDIEFKSPSYTAGCKYKYTISGIKKAGSNSYTSISGYFTVPKASSLIKEVEYDAEDRELSVEFRKNVSWKNPSVKIYKTSGELVCSGRVVERDNDSIEVILSKSLTYAKRYKCTVSGVKARTATSYKTVSKVFKAVED